MPAMCQAKLARRIQALLHIVFHKLESLYSLIKIPQFTMIIKVGNRHMPSVSHICQKAGLVTRYK